jgi:hypothetical protein
MCAYATYPDGSTVLAPTVLGYRYHEKIGGTYDVVDD